MTADGDELVRQALLDMPAASPGAQERFERQVREILEQRLAGAARGLRLAAVVMFSLAGLYCAWAAAYATFWAHGAAPPAARLAVLGGCGAGAVMLFGGAGYTWREYRAGAVAPRRVQKTAVAIRYACVFFIGALAAAYPAVRQLPTSKAHAFTVFGAVLWTAGLAFAAGHVLRWRHEDLMLEEKRTQLQLVVLQETLDRIALSQAGGQRAKET
jgi:hypothetical protein